MCSRQGSGHSDGWVEDRESKEVVTEASPGEGDVTPGLGWRVRRPKSEHIELSRGKIGFQSGVHETKFILV